jgi:RNA polymerase sigma-70 factor (ECF subfamily)
METMQKLALGYRTVLNLYAIEGYSHAEIAEMLGINEGTSKSQLARARAVFIKEYKKIN